MPTCLFPHASNYISSYTSPLPLDLYKLKNGTCNKFNRKCFPRCVFWDPSPSTTQEGCGNATQQTGSIGSHLHIKRLEIVRLRQLLLTTTSFSYVTLVNLLHTECIIRNAAPEHITSKELKSELILFCECENEGSPSHQVEFRREAWPHLPAGRGAASMHQPPSTGDSNVGQSTQRNHTTTDFNRCSGTVESSTLLLQMSDSTLFSSFMGVRSTV